ncbi:ankyrin repeat domain-containing protein [Propylenella binzhouense]|uniref:Ankyrin repeat domain-containing protein n=1 Tax=Propylenella binzhouense TaxID=2555902 RepID=A0A964T6N7_9HYPH|nr:ankyrin repeat domain-containing protein [Propylenella binzhouense]
MNRAMVCFLAALASAGPARGQTGDYGRDANPIVCAEMTARLTEGEGGQNDRTRNLLLDEAAEKGCVSLVETLLERGAAIESRDRFANSPLIHAAAGGRTGIVRLLLDRGAEIDHRNLNGSTALLRAVSGNHRGTVELLLARGASVELVARSGITPLGAAAYNGNSRIVRMLLASGADPNEADGTGKSPLIYAAAKGASAIVKELIAAGADPNRTYGHDLTALMWAAGHPNDVPEAEGLATVKLLLEAGVAVDPVDDRGRSALMIAAERGHPQIVAWLAEHGADPVRRDKKGLSARDLASAESVRAVLARAAPPR